MLTWLMAVGYWLWAMGQNFLMSNIVITDQHDDMLCQ
jgi:hypothetical protein